MTPVAWERFSGVERTDYHRNAPSSRQIYVLRLECGFRVAKAAVLENPRRKVQS